MLAKEARKAKDLAENVPWGEIPLPPREGVYSPLGSNKRLNLIYTMPNQALSKPMKLSAELAAVIGEGDKPRSEVTKKIWEYIKKNNLQNPENKRNILADDKLKAVFGGKGEVTMFEMTKLVNKHLS